MEIQLAQRLLPGCIQIRTEVFMREQGFQQEFDAIDQSAIHVLITQDGQPIATGRAYANGDPGIFVIGRVAVRKSWRGRGYGAAVLRALQAEIERQGGRMILIFSQLHAVPFYKKLGYAATGETSVDEGCPHEKLQKKLNPVSTAIPAKESELSRF